MNRRGLLKLAGAAVASAAPAGVLAREGSRAKPTDRWIPSAPFLESVPQLMKLAALPGLSMAVVERGALAWTSTHGVVNAGTSDVVRAGTLFEAASISKPVFAYGVLQLVDRKLLELDRPLARYLRPPYLPDDPRIDEITARHVLTHTSGLPNWGDETRPDTLRPAFRPGRWFRYSGEGFFWLQLVAERVTGKGLDAVMRELLFEPAEMSSAMFAIDETHLPDLAFGHRNGVPVTGQGMRSVMGLIAPRAKEWNKPVRDWTHEDWIRVGAELNPQAPPARVRFQNAAGSLVITAADYARFMALLCAGRRREPWELSEALRREMIAPQVAIQDGVPLWWGLGWALERGARELRFAHEGNNDNLFASYAIGDAANGRALVILTNGGSGFGVLQRMVRAATASDPLSFIAALDPPRAG